MKLTTYYRFTNGGPMSDWGHAMFAGNRLMVEGYGRNEYILDEAHTISIYDLEEKIKEAWGNCQENEDFGQLSDTEFYMTYSADAVFNDFCPDNIVDSADGFDHELVGWLWDFVLAPKGIMAVRTQDGAVCFDEKLIEKVGA